MDQLPISFEQLIFLLIVLGAGFVNWLKSKMEERQLREDDTPPDFDWEENTSPTDYRKQGPRSAPDEVTPELPPFLKRAIEAMGIPEDTLKPQRAEEDQEQTVSHPPPVVPTARERAAEIATAAKAKAKEAATTARQDSWKVVNKLADREKDFALASLKEREKGLTHAERKALRRILDQKADEEIYRIREKPVHSAVPVHSLLKPQNIRAAFILQEILGQPKGLPSTSQNDSDRP